MMVKKKKEKWMKERSGGKEQDKSRKKLKINTVCPRSSSDPFYIVSYYITWVTTSWTHSK